MTNREEGVDGVEDLKPEILTKIQEHLQTHGPRNWDVLREDPRYAGVIGAAAGESGRRKFWRWRKSVSRSTPADRTRPHEGRAASARQEAWAKNAAAEANAGQLPVQATAGYLMRTGAGGLQKLADMAAIIGQVLEDAERVRDHVLMDDPTAIGGRRPKSSAMLLKAGRQQLDVVRAALRLYREIEELSQQERFYEGLFKILDSELSGHPEVHRRVVHRLQTLMLNLNQPNSEDD